MSAEAEKRAIEEMVVRWLEATRRGGEAGADGYASFATEAAVFLPPDQPRVSGREAVREMALGFTSLDGFGMDWWLTWVEVASDGVHAEVMGEFELSMTGPDGEPVTMTGKFFDSLEKQFDGEWRARIACWNSDQPLG